MSTIFKTLPQSLTTLVIAVLAGATCDYLMISSCVKYLIMAAVISGSLYLFKLGPYQFKYN